MRTTIYIEDDLLKKAKEYSAKKSISLTRFIEEAIRVRLSRIKDHKKTKPIKLPTFKGQGVQPGVDLNDTQGLLTMMEERH